MLWVSGRDAIMIYTQYLRKCVYGMKAAVSLMQRWETVPPKVGCRMP